MIDAKQIPKAVVEAAYRGYWHEKPNSGFAEAIAAALNAWETPTHRVIVGKALDEVGSMYPAIIIPLTQEPRT